MPHPIATLDAMPTATDFYGLYWNRQPFVVRSAIDEGTMADLISANELAALSMEETSRSRMVKSVGSPIDNPQGWSCRFGPFSEQDFDTAGNQDWSLLVQNVEQFHPETARLLHHFNIAPRWLMDDVMVSFSAPGGTVGPHIDSYHVFLVQGEGRRRWKVGHAPIANEVFIQGMELKVLETGFDGSDIEVSAGDVLYIPPRFGHEGSTLESALTFSVGFLGPKTSELFSAYSQHLSEREEHDERYVGNDLNANSAGFVMHGEAVDTIRSHLGDSLNSADFNQWLVEFFTESSHEDFGEYTERDDPLSPDALKKKLEQGASLHKPAYVKFALTSSDTSSSDIYLGFNSQSFTLDKSLLPLVQRLMDEQPVNITTHPVIGENPSILGFMLELYNHQALEFATHPR